MYGKTYLAVSSRWGHVIDSKNMSVLPTTMHHAYWWLCGYMQTYANIGYHMQTYVYYFCDINNIDKSIQVFKHIYNYISINNKFDYQLISLNINYPLCNQYFQSIKVFTWPRLILLLVGYTLVMSHTRMTHPGMYVNRWYIHHHRFLSM